jgi:hypothetical protein
MTKKCINYFDNLQTKLNLELEKLKAPVKDIESSKSTQDKSKNIDILFKN